MKSTNVDGASMSLMLHSLWSRWRCLLSALLLGLLLILAVSINLQSFLTVRFWPADPQSRDCAVSRDAAAGHDDIYRHRSMYVIEEFGVYFYKAYHDSRQTTRYIRVLGVHRNDSDVSDFWCVWNSSTGILWQVKADCQSIDENWPLHNKYFAFMMTCQLPDSAPDSVRVSRGRRSVLLPVHQSTAARGSRDTLAVCVKPITGPFSASRVVEWVELHVAAGYRRLILYDTDLQGSGRYVLEYYQSQGLVDVVRFPFLMAILDTAERRVSLGGELRYALYQQVYLVALQDCVLRFQHRYKYLAMIDLDEVILPAVNLPINDILRKAERRVPDVVSYVFYTYWHFREFSTPSPEIPDDLYMQRFAWAPPPTLDQPKSILNTARVLTVNWHGVVSVLERKHTARYLLSHSDYASVHHFRDGSCSEHFRELCRQMASSTAPCRDVTRYRNVTQRRVRQVMGRLQV